MIYKIIGIENFTAKSGNLICKIHSVYQKSNVSGLACESFVILQDNVPSDITIDVKFKPLYSRQGDKGFLAGIQIIEE